MREGRASAGRKGDSPRIAIYASKEQRPSQWKGRIHGVLTPDLFISLVDPRAPLKSETRGHYAVLHFQQAHLICDTEISSGIRVARFLNFYGSLFHRIGVMIERPALYLMLDKLL